MYIWCVQPSIYSHIVGTRDTDKYATAAVVRWRGVARLSIVREK